MIISIQERLVNPPGSEYTKLNVWLDALPEAGATDTAAGGLFAPKVSGEKSRRRL